MQIRPKQQREEQVDFEESEDVMDFEELLVRDMLDTNDELTNRDFELSSLSFSDSIEEPVDAELAAMEQAQAERDLINDLIPEGTLWEGLD
jgi:hypothetical protein